jgi:hypothetical protein
MDETSLPAPSPDQAGEPTSSAYLEIRACPIILSADEAIPPSGDPPPAAPSPEPANLKIITYQLSWRQREPSQ